MTSFLDPAGGVVCPAFLAQGGGGGEGGGLLGGDGGCGRGEEGGLCACGEEREAGEGAGELSKRRGLRSNGWQWSMGESRYHWCCRERCRGEGSRALLVSTSGEEVDSRTEAWGSRRHRVEDALHDAAAEAAHAGREG